MKFLCDRFPVGEERRKPLVMHSLRVGVGLYQNDYSDDVVLAGLLHDVVEWTDSSEELVQKEFGKSVFDIVIANTQDDNIGEKTERWQDMVLRCVELGSDALIVKAADVLDSYKFYQAVNNSEELARSVSIARFIIEKLPKGIEDPIFEELKTI